MLPSSVGIFYLIGLFDLWSGLRTILISAIGTYAIAFFLRQSPYMPWLAFVFVMGHMSVSHIARQAANAPQSGDVTGAQMVMVMKLSAFAWNVADGALPEEVLSDFQKDRRLPELPNLLDYAGYVFFFPSLLVGPAFDFAEYRRWLDCTMFDVPTTIDPAKKPPTRRKRKIPRSGTPAMLKLAAGLIWIVLFLKLSALYYPEVLLEDDYPQYGFLHKLWILHMVGFTARSKYYGVWTMTEGSCILAGLGYNGVDPVTVYLSHDETHDRTQAMIPLNCPEGDVTGEELAACLVYQGTVYSIGVDSVGLLPHPGETAAAQIFLPNLLPALWDNPQFGETGPKDPPAEIFKLSGCQE